MKKILCATLVIIMVFFSFAGCDDIPEENPPVTPPDTPTEPPVEGAVGELDITLFGASFESVYCEWTPAEGADGYNVYCDGKAVDGELIRFYGDYYRCDIPGLTAAEHTVRIVPTKDGAEKEDGAGEFKATPVVHIREGFAFDGGGDANGAYNADGTLKSGAVVVYVTNENKDTVSLEMRTDKSKTETKVGIQNILLGLKKGYYEHPLCIRFIGNITDPAVLQNGDLKLDINDGAFSKGLTLEGIGKDATFNGFGLCVKGAKNVEIRNLGFMNCNSGEGDNISLQQDNSYIWVHNCDLFYGDAGSDADQAKGDGALDVKRSSNITISFNHYIDSGKCNLQGMKDETVENCITYHHNWYDHSDSRHPRVRTCTVHVYNNYYDGVSKYGIGATMGASIFAENNYFRNTNRPMSISMQGLDSGTFSSEDGGIIKAFGNVIDGQKGKELITYSQNNSSFDYYDAKSRDEKVPATVKALAGGSTYSNFDTAADMYSYNVQSAEDARDTVIQYAGRVQGGDFKWEFTAADDSDYDVNTALKAALKAYKTSLVSVGGTGACGNTGSGDSTGAGDNTDSGDNTGSESGDNKPTVSGSAVHIFEVSGTESSVFSIKGNLSTSKGTATYNGATYKKCLKIESEGKMTITFTPSEDMTLILVFGTAKNRATIKINGEGVDAQTTDAATTTAILTFEVEAGGEYTLTRNGVESHLFYMELVPKE
ncbi:MAG: pectate lyase [Clostridia bacterium]|nr:pectate lyase [Clostridia bacterium]